MEISVEISEKALKIRCVLTVMRIYLVLSAVKESQLVFK